MWFFINGSLKRIFRSKELKLFFRLKKSAPVIFFVHL